MEIGAELRLRRRVDHFRRQMAEVAAPPHMLETFLSQLLGSEATWGVVQKSAPGRLAGRLSEVRNSKLPDIVW